MSLKNCIVEGGNEGRITQQQAQEATDLFESLDLRQPDRAVVDVPHVEIGVFVDRFTSRMASMFSGGTGSSSQSRLNGSSA